MSGLRGMPVRAAVSRHEPAQERLAGEVRDVLLGRKVTRVVLEGEQLVIQVDSGQALVFMISGGFRKVG